MSNSMTFELNDVSGCDLTLEEMKVNAARTEMINCILKVYASLVKENVPRLDKFENLTLSFQGNILEVQGGLDTIKVDDDSYQGVYLGQQFRVKSHFPYSFLSHLNLI